MNTTSNGKVRRSEAEWSKIISTYRKSGLSQVAFCEQQGIAKSSFSKWCRRLRASVPAKDDFIEVKAPESCWDFEFDLGNDVVIRMRRG